MSLVQLWLSIKRLYIELHRTHISTQQIGVETDVEDGKRDQTKKKWEEVLWPYSEMNVKKIEMGMRNA